MKDGALWRYPQSLAQNLFAFCLAAGGTVEVGKIHIGRNKKRVQTDRGLDLFFGFPGIASIAVKGSKIVARFRPVRIVALGLYILSGSKAARCSALNCVTGIGASRLTAPMRTVRIGAERSGAANCTRAFSGAVANVSST